MRRKSYGPDPVIRYNGYPAADLLGEADPRVAVVEPVAPQAQVPLRPWRPLR